MSEKTKCMSINLPEDQVELLRAVKEKSGKSQSAILTESVVSGLKKESVLADGKALFLVKVKIDTDRMMELGAKLQSGELDTSAMLFTWCEKADPDVGIALWTADSKEHFDRIFAPHLEYYREVEFVNEVVTPQTAMQMLMG